MYTKRRVSRIIMRTIKNNAPLSVLMICAVACSVAAALIPPLILADIIDMIAAKKNVSLYLCLLYFAVTASAGIADSAKAVLLTVFGQKITHALRSSLMDKYVHLSAESLAAQEPGAVVSRFVGDVDTVETLFTDGVISMFADACKIVSILFVIWCKNKGLTIVLFILLPFLFIFTSYVQKNMLAAQLKNRNAVSRASGHVPETIRNIRTIHTLAKEKYMQRRYEEYIDESYRAVDRTNFFDAVYSPVILILNAVVTAAVMLFSASGNADILKLFGMSAGTAVAVVNYISQIFSPVESLGMEIQTIQSAIAGVRRINDFMKLEENTAESTASESGRTKSSKTESVGTKDGTTDGSKTESVGTEDSGTESIGAEGSGTEGGITETAAAENNCAAADMPCVKFENVTFGYDDRPVLKNLSFDVAKGEQVTLTGRTGAGKSTIFKLLLGLYKADDGGVFINGKNVSDITENERRLTFGCVEQSFHMVPGTVKEQITLYDERITDEQVKEAARTAGLDTVIEELKDGYETECTPEMFSQGQWQLLSIARAAAAEPEILLLDEITANLDAETERQVLVALQRASCNRTVISISHRLAAKRGRNIPLKPADYVDIQSAAE